MNWAESVHFDDECVRLVFRKTRIRVTMCDACLETRGSMPRAQTQPVAVGQAGVGTVLQKQGNDREAAMQARAHQGNAPVLCGVGHVGAKLQQ